MLWTVLFYGSSWGIFESVVGYFLHLLPIRIGSFIWLPVACFFMHQVYIATGKYKSIIYISALSATIKLINLFMPVSIDKVINPSISILIEGCIFALILYLTNEEKIKLSSVAKAFIFNTLWRTVYLVYLLLIPQWMFDKSALASVSNFIEFMVIANIKSGIGLYLFFKFQEKLPIFKKVKPVFALLFSVINVFCMLTL